MPLRIWKLFGGLFEFRQAPALGFLAGTPYAIVGDDGIGGGGR